MMSASAVGGIIVDTAVAIGIGPPTIRVVAPLSARTVRTVAWPLHLVSEYWA